MAISDLLAGMVQGYGGNMSDRIARQTARQEQERAATLNFLMETIGHDDLLPEGRSVVAGMLGKMFQENSGQNPLDFMQALSRVYETGPAMKPGPVRMSPRSEMAASVPIPSFEPAGERLLHFRDPREQTRQDYRDKLRIEGEEDLRARQRMLGAAELSGGGPLTEPVRTEILTGIKPLREQSRGTPVKVKDASGRTIYMDPGQAMDTGAEVPETESRAPIGSRMGKYQDIFDYKSKVLGLPESDAHKATVTELEEMDKRDAEDRKLKIQTAKLLNQARQLALERKTKADDPKYLAKLRVIRDNVERQVNQILTAEARSQDNYDALAERPKVLSEVLAEMGTTVEEYNSLLQPIMNELLYGDLSDAESEAESYVPPTR